MVSSRIGVRALIIAIGFTAAVAQIVLLRELLVVFHGNEITIGLTLASWLIWTAAGSAFGGRLGARHPQRLVAGVQVSLAVVLPGTVLAVREAKNLLQTVPGEILGPGMMLATSLAVLGPLCLLAGALFPAASRMCEGGPAAVYLWEAIGSSAGGLAAGLALVRVFGSLEIACLVGMVNLLTACALAVRGRALRYTAIGVAVAAAIAATLSGVPRRAEHASEERFWRGQHLIAERNSVYGNLAVIGTESSRSVYENGVVLFTVPDPEAAEEAVDYALLEHPAPRSLLLIGGGLNGSIREALRHPNLERVDYVELDPAILDLVREYLPDDSRVRVHIADGRQFVKNTGSTFDVAVVNLPDPVNAQLNRFYTAEFFQEIARKLSDDGVLALQVRASENYIAPKLGELLATIHKTLASVFPAVGAIPGETVHFFAARRAGVLASGAAELLARLRARNLATSYVSEAFIPYRMAPDRMRDLEAQFQGTGRTAVNRDFAPIAYYLDVAFWSSQFHPGSRGVFDFLAGIPFAGLVWGLGITLAVLVLGARGRPRLAAGCCTASTGFNMIAAEMLLLLGFQALYGYVYQQLALLIAAFMAGMALGSWLALRRPAPARMVWLGITQLLVAAAPLVLAGLMAAMPVKAAAFSAAAVVCGMLGGFEFPLASRVFFAPEEKRFGALYALDLAGSSLGAILIGAWLVPVFGFFKTGLLAAMLGLAPAVMALSTASGKDPAERAHSNSGPPRTPAP
jgi:spermidine synthase